MSDGELHPHLDLPSGPDPARRRDCCRCALLVDRQCGARVAERLRAPGLVGVALGRSRRHGACGAAVRRVRRDRTPGVDLAGRHGDGAAGPGAPGATSDPRRRWRGRPVPGARPDDGRGGPVDGPDTGGEPARGRVGGGGRDRRRGRCGVGLRTDRGEPGPPSSRLRGGRGAAHQHGRRGARRSHAGHRRHPGLVDRQRVGRHCGAAGGGVLDARLAPVDALGLVGGVRNPDHTRQHSP
jgi:hypothetical protein